MTPSQPSRCSAQAESSVGIWVKAHKKDCSHAFFQPNPLSFPLPGEPEGMILAQDAAAIGTAGTLGVQSW